MFEGDLIECSSPGCSSDKVDSVRNFANGNGFELEVCSASSSEDSDNEEPVSEISDALMSDCAIVYFSFTISSTRGVRNDTFFSAGKRGRIDILRRFARGWIGLLARTEFRTCDIEYGIVAEFTLEAELTEDELGVRESSASTSSCRSGVDWIELSMQRRGRIGRPVVLDWVRSGSYPLANVLIAVGDTADNVYSRKLDPLPNVLACEVLSESLGRVCRGFEGARGCWVRRGGVTIREVVILFEDRS